MKKMTFTKMSGAGNDFIVIEARKNLNYKKTAVAICDRTEGVGADGLLILDRSRKADFRMRIFNADGSEAEMCGNGVRCLAGYIQRVKRPGRKALAIETKAGTIQTRVGRNDVRARLSDPRGYRADVRITVNGRALRVHYIDTGVPHVVVFVDGLEKMAVREIGRVIRFHRRLAPRGANVNFVEQIATNRLSVRTYERGIEDETCACGTGSVAAALAAYAASRPGLPDGSDIPMSVRTKSGHLLNVTFSVRHQKFFNVWLRGETRFIADGSYYPRS